MHALFPDTALNPRTFGSKAKLSEGEEENDILDINVNSIEFEEPRLRISSVVVVPDGSKEKELLVDSSAANERKPNRLSSVAVASDGSKKKELSVVSATADAHKSSNRERELFPHPPRKVAEWAVRKPSHHGRHSSNIPRGKTNTITHSDSTKRSNGNTLSVSFANKATGASSVESARSSTSAQRYSSRQSSFDANRRVTLIPPRRQLINRLADIPNRVDAATQTEPCKCQIRMRTKNRNRRMVAKQNRDIVRSLNANNEPNA